MERSCIRAVVAVAPTGARCCVEREGTFPSLKDVLVFSAEHSVRVWILVVEDDIVSEREDEGRGVENVLKLLIASAASLSESADEFAILCRSNY